MQTKIKKIFLPILLVFFYIIFFYFFLTNGWKNGFLISIDEISSINIITKFFFDFISSLLIVIVILLILFIEKKPLTEVGITLKSPKLMVVLFIIYLLLFLVNSDFTIKGFYTAFFYSVIIAFSEEFIFRGYLFAALDKEIGFWFAVIISGSLFGLIHAFLPSITKNYSTIDFIKKIISEILGQGILMSAFYAIIYKKSKTLFIPVLVHAILDYSSIFFK